VIHLIHGIHTEGVSPIDALIPFIPAPIAYPDYGWIAGLETKVANPIIVGCLMPYIARSDILIGHSNGCAIAYDLMNRGVAVAGAIFINGALEQNITRPAGCPWIDVYYNEGDDITEAAKLGAELGLTDPVWGEMGHAGYRGADAKITNINCGGTPGLPYVSGHSDFFVASKLAWWGPFLSERLKAHLS
jgi:hypothetical protein